MTAIISIMSLDTMKDLSISDLLRLLGEKLNIECIRLQETPLSPASSAISLKSEVSLQAHHENRPTRSWQIDNLEAKVQDALRFVSSFRNLLRPINRLPPEILSAIARNIVKGYPDASRMVPLTHVCRRWRQSLISIPENWTLISNLEGDLAAVFLRRAKAAPLEIAIYIPFPFPQILESYVQNTRNLTVNSISTIEQFTEIFPNFPQSMPRLQSLQLNSDDELEEDWSMNPFEAFTFPLESLSLTGSLSTRRYSGLELSRS